MGYFLGIDVGAARTVAAVARAGSDDVEILDLGDVADPDGDGVASVLHLGADGVLAVGAAAQEWAAREPDRVVHGFPGRIGDDAMLLAGEPWAPEELTAWLVRWVVDRVAEREGGPATRVAVSHPASWDAERTQLLADAVAEQELEVSFLAPPPDAADHDVADVPVGDPVVGRGAGAPAARAAARALRAAAAVPSSSMSPALVPAPTGSIDGAGSGRHAAVGDSGAAVAADTVDGPGSGRHLVVGDAIAALAAAGPVGSDPGPEAEATVDEDVDEPADDAGADPALDAGAEDGGSDDGGGGWDVPAPRRPEPPGSHPADPATRNLVADLVGFTGGMGATNTAGLLSGYTPPHGMPAQWSGSPAAAPSGTTMTSTGESVALPAQRTDSGRWGAVAPAEDAAAVGAPAGPRANPTVLVGAGGLAAAVAVVATLFLWPAPRVTNSAVRPVAAVPAASAVEPTSAVSLTTTPEPVPTRRPRPAPPRPRRPAVPPVTVTTEPTDTTPPPTGSTEPTEPTTSPPSTEPTEPTTTTKHHDN